MIKTLKSELKLRPTYDEMIGMIEAQGDENRPSIEQVIDRRATIFRNNQFGSQFDNVDFLGLKKQEEDRAREHLRHAGINARESTGIMDVRNLRRAGFVTPSEAELSDPEEMDRFYANLENFSRQQREREQNAMNIINASILGDTERYRESVRQQQFEMSEMAKNDLSDVHSQSLPAGVPVHSMDVPVTSNQGYPPPLPPPPPQEEEEEEDIIDEFGVTGGFVPDRIMNSQDMKSTGLMFQLFARDLLTDEMIELTDRLPDEQKKKQYLVLIIEGLKETDEWQQSDFSGKRVKQEAKKFRERIRKNRNRPRIQEGGSSSSSGGGIGSAIASGAKALGGAVLDAGKEAVKEAVVAGARGAVMSLI